MHSQATFRITQHVFKTRAQIAVLHCFVILPKCHAQDLSLSLLLKQNPLEASRRTTSAERCANPIWRSNVRPTCDGIQDSEKSPEDQLLWRKPRKPGFRQLRTSITLPQRRRHWAEVKSIGSETLVNSSNIICSMSTATVGRTRRLRPQMTFLPFCGGM